MEKQPMGCRRVLAPALRDTRLLAFRAGGTNEAEAIVAHAENCRAATVTSPDAAATGIEREPRLLQQEERYPLCCLYFGALA